MWTLWQDARYALRTLRKSLAFTTVAVIALAIRIGANTAIFSVVNAVVLQPLPYKNPGRLVILWGNVLRPKVDRRVTSYPDFADWRAQSKSFEDMAAFGGANFTLTGVDEPERLLGEFVSASYFRLLGISAVQGRTFLSEEDQVPGRNAVAILGDGVWRRRFGADPRIIGKTIQLNAANYTVVGVMPAGFQGVLDHAQVWVPFMMSGAAAVPLDQRGARWFPVLGRLRAGAALAGAQAEMDAVCRQLALQYPGTNETRGIELEPLDHQVFGQIRPALLLLLSAVGLVLLIACANVANLLLARSEARQREIAIRTALGAGRLRLWRQLLTESCVLALIGATAGLLLATFGIRALMAFSPVRFPGYVHPRIDLSVAMFTLLVSFLCGILMGLAPASHARVARLHLALKESSGRVSGGGLRRHFRDALVVAEVSLTLILLIGASLLIRTFREVNALNPGFNPNQLLALRLTLPRDTQTVISTRQILEKVRAIPSVQSVSAASDLPLDGSTAALFYVAEGQPPVTPQNMPRSFRHSVTPEFFATLAAPLVAGRTFSEEEISSNAQVVIVSEGLVKRFWPAQNPIDKRIKFCPDGSCPWFRIVGVAAEMKYRGLPNNPTAEPDIYLPLSDRQRDIALLVRSSLDAAGLSAAVRATIHEADPSVPIYNLASMVDHIDRQTARSRFTSWLMGIFAAVALLLAMVGVYGVMSYAVTRRTQEIGIRMALGARHADVLWLVVRQGMVVVLLGIALGLAGSFGLTRLIATLLYGVTATDTLTFAAAPVILVLIALFACWLPALRAGRVDPLVALRYE